MSEEKYPRRCMLTPVRFSHRVRSHQYWFYRCECGVEKTVRQSHVKAGTVKSCGCMLREFRKRINERLTPESYRRSAEKRKGMKNKNSGKICIYQFENKRGKGSRRQYVTKQELEEIWRGEREVVWD